MKAFICIAILSLSCGVALAESAHKGWSAKADQWPHSIPLRSFSLQGPWVRIDKPDPPPKGTFSSEIWFNRDAKLELQKVYLLSLSDDGTLKQREIKATALTFSTENVEGPFWASFKTEELSFNKGDVFAVVLKIGGKPTTIFLRILYIPFVPS